MKAADIVVGEDYALARYGPTQWSQYRNGTTLGDDDLERCTVLTVPENRAVMVRRYPRPGYAEEGSESDQQTRDLIGRWDDHLERKAARAAAAKEREDKRVDDFDRIKNVLGPIVYAKHEGAIDYATFSHRGNRAISPGALADIIEAAYEIGQSEADEG